MTIRRGIGLLVMGAALGPLIVFGGVLYAGCKLRLDSRDVVPVWYWLVGVGVLLGGVWLVWTGRER